MQTMLLFFLLLLLTDGVSGAETNETESVMEGDSVTLHTDITEIQNDDTILWLFGPKESVISQITRKADFTSFFVTDDMRFRGRLQVDQKTGSLTIRNTRIRHSGKYKLTISREKTRYKIYIVTVYGVVGETDEVKSESVMEGKSVTLQNNVEVQRDDLIVWRFGDKGILLAKIDVETKEISLNDADERFKDRLQLNQNGSLTIKKTKTENAGLYGLQIRGRESAQRFLLSVSAVGDPGLSPGVIAGIVVAALLGLGAVVVYYRCKISELKKQMVEDTKSRRESVIEGQSITLPTDLTELQKDDKIKWWYQDESNLIAEINKETNHSSRCGGTDGRFRGKLKLYENGNLQITDIRTIHSGLYKLEIHNNRRTKYKNFIVSVSVKTQSVKEGGSVLLETTATIQRGDLLLWMFGAEKSLVATNATWPDTTDERFAGRVELNKKNGWLTIRNVRRTDTGHYKLQIINSKQTTCRRFNVDVTDSTGSQGNDSLTVVTPLLKDDVAGGEEELDELVFVEMLNR